MNTCLFLRRLCGAVFIFGALGVVFSVQTFAAKITFSPVSVSPNVNDSFTVTVSLDATGEQIAGQKAVVAFDPSALSFVSFSKGNFFDTIISSNNTNNVSIDFVNLDTSAETGIGVLGNITFRYIKTGSTKIELLCDATATNSSSLIKKENPTQNVIDCTTQAKVDVGTGTSTVPSVTPNLVISPIPSPTIGQLPQTNAIPPSPTPGLALQAQTSLPVAGEAETTAILASSGLALIAGGLLLHLRRNVWFMI